MALLWHKPVTLRRRKRVVGGNRGNSSGSPAQTSSSSTSEKPYTKVLGVDSKLLPAEKAHWIAEKPLLALQR
jgi:hypothetical protein